MRYSVAALLFLLAL
jgi:hypothetical protein